MRRADIVARAEVYYAPGPDWRVVPPKKATVVNPGPYRINRVRQGALYTVSWQRDDAGTAVLVDLDERFRVRRCAVPRRDLRGLWLETLAATGRTVAGVKAHQAAVSELAANPTAEGLLRLAACDEGLPDGVFGALAEVADEER